MNEDGPWPTLGSSIFTVKYKGHYSACLKWAQGRPYGYTEGYRHAAELVFTHVAETRGGMDTLVFPLMYLWRHGIELQLKVIVAEGYLLLDRAGPGKKPDYPFDHNLLTVWRAAKEVIVNVADGNEPPEVAAVEHVLCELQGLDPDGSGWRYFETKRGEFTLKDPPKTLDLPNLHEVLSGVFSFLECVKMEITQRLEAKSEMEANLG